MRLRVHLDSDKLDETQSFTDSLATTLVALPSKSLESLHSLSLNEW